MLSNASNSWIYVWLTTLQFYAAPLYSIPPRTLNQEQLHFLFTMLQEVCSLSLVLLKRQTTRVLIKSVKKVKVL